MIVYVKIQKKNEDLQSIMSNLQLNSCLKVDFQKVNQHTGGKLCYVVHLNNGNWRLTMPVVKGHSARDTLPQTLISACLNPVKKIDHNKICLQWICKLDTQLYCCFLHQWLMEFSINRTSDWHGGYADICSPLLHKRLRICSLINPTAMEKLMPFPTKIYTVML